MDLSPIFVGDFNFPNCGGGEECSYDTANLMRNDYLWANRPRTVTSVFDGNANHHCVYSYSYGSCSFACSE